MFETELDIAELVNVRIIDDSVLVETAPELKDFLWYLSVLEITPNEFFKIFKNYTELPVKVENDIKPSWEIYLGEERENE